MGERRRAELARPFASPETGEQGSRRSVSIAPPLRHAGSTASGEGHNQLRGGSASKSE
jgi:hypothetical protein